MKDFPRNRQPSIYDTWGNTGDAQLTRGATPRRGTMQYCRFLTILNLWKLQLGLSLTPALRLWQF
jgi:hypothetical protein